jgi:hypothetical protein
MSAIILTTTVSEFFRENSPKKFGLSAILPFGCTQKRSEVLVTRNKGY